MKRWICLVLLTLTCCSSKNSSVNFLFLLQSKQGEVTQDESKHRLIMKQVYKNVVYLTNAPVRKAGHIDVQSFIDDWVQKEDPTAGLIGVLAEKGIKGQSVSAVIISNPYYDKEKDLISFDLKPVAPDIPIQTGKMLNITIFVDDPDCPSCKGASL